jgi:hypothetical protein
MSHADFVRRQETQAAGKSAKDQRLDDLRLILVAASGRRYMKGLLTFHGIFQTSQARNSQEMAEEKGRRNAGIRILEEIKEADPELAINMLLNI